MRTNANVTKKMKNSKEVDGEAEDKDGEEEGEEDNS